MEIVSTFEGMEMDIHIHIPLKKLVTGVCLVAFLMYLYVSACSQVEKLSDVEVRREAEFARFRAAGTMEMVTRDGSRRFSMVLGRLRCLPPALDVPVSDVPAPKVRKADLVQRTVAVPSSQPVVPGITAREEEAEDSSAGGVDVPGMETERPAEKEPVPLTWKVVLRGNGGRPAESEYVFDSDAFSLSECEEPSRLGKLFDGWYEDAACTVPFSGADGKGGELELYAGWKEFEGFTANDEGLLTSCTNIAPLVTDGLLVLPVYDTCTGVAANAFDGVDVEITDIYIPANIHRIEPGAFDCLLSLVYIEAAPDNPYYYSEEGILYNWNGTVAAEPKG